MRYYWFDTNCFSDLINNLFSSSEKETILSDIKKGNGAIVISPFVFYEIIKGRNKLTEIKELYDNLISLPDFYIANYMNVFETPYELIDGKTHITQMKMHEVLGEVPIEYLWYHPGYKKQLGIPYARHMTEYSKIASVIYLICDECDERGHISDRTKTKIERIEVFNQIGGNQKVIEELFSDFFVHYNSRTIWEDKVNDYHLMQEQLLVFVNSILSVAESRMQLIEENQPYNKQVFNERVSENERRNHIDLVKYHKVLDNVAKKTNKILSPKIVFEKYVKDKIGSSFFKLVSETFVCKRVFYKNINNDFIDALNLYCAGAFLKGRENIYYTNERFWFDFVKKHSRDNIFDGYPLLCKTRV